MLTARQGCRIEVGEGGNSNPELFDPYTNYVEITDLGQTNAFTYLSSVRLQIMSVDLESPFLEGTGEAYVCHKETFQ